MEEFFGLFWFAGLLLVTYFTGRYVEKRHFRRLEIMERSLKRLPVNTFKRLPQDHTYQQSTLVWGSCVMSSDYFRKFGASLINIFGGRVTFFEGMVDRARREAALRMKMSAMKLGAREIVNVHFTTSPIGDAAKDTPTCIEVVAYGTALK